MQVRKLNNAVERDAALHLALRVFMQFEAPDYSDEGIANFKSFTESPDQTSALEMYGAFENDSLLGILATRSAGRHISLFFVEEKHQRQGIGKQLFQTALANASSAAITVNSSPYAVEIYRKLGFTGTDIEQETAGIRYTPMVFCKPR